MQSKIFLLNILKKKIDNLYITLKKKLKITQENLKKKLYIKSIFVLEILLQKTQKIKNYLKKIIELLVSFWKKLIEKVRISLITTCSFFFNYITYFIIKNNGYDGKRLLKNIKFLVLMHLISTVIGLLFNLFLLTQIIVFRWPLFALLQNYFIAILFLFVINSILKILGLKIILTSTLIFLIMLTLTILYVKIKKKKKISEIIWLKFPFFYSRILQKVNLFNKCITILNEKKNLDLPKIEFVMFGD